MQWNVNYNLLQKNLSVFNVRSKTLHYIILHHYFDFDIIEDQY